MCFRSLDSSDDGVEKFYPSSPPASNNVSASSTPITGSPLLDGGSSPLPTSSTRSSAGGGIFSHLKSSRNRNVSKEDLSAHSNYTANLSEKAKEVGAKKRPPAFDTISAPIAQNDRKSPVPTSKHHEAAKHKYGVGSGLSCLASETNDEDSPPPIPHAATKPSPDKKVTGSGTGNTSLSPSMQSISDIFAKQASGKTSNKLSGLSPGVSPFANRKIESPGSVAEDKLTERRTSLTNNQDSSKADPVGSPESGGKRTPEGVVRRQGVGHGTNPELMAEIKEKRASMVPKTNVGEENIAVPKLDDEKDKSDVGSSNASNNVFGRVRLR